MFLRAKYVYSIYSKYGFKVKHVVRTVLVKGGGMHCAYKMFFFNPVFMFLACRFYMPTH